MPLERGPLLVRIDSIRWSSTAVGSQLLRAVVGRARRVCLEESSAIECVLCHKMDRCELEVSTGLAHTSAWLEEEADGELPKTDLSRGAGESLRPASYGGSSPHESLSWGELRRCILTRKRVARAPRHQLHALLLSLTPNTSPSLNDQTQSWREGGL